MKVILGLIVLILILSLIFFKNKEQFVSYGIDAIEPGLKQEVELILNLVIDDINRNYNKKLYVGSIDRVEKTMNESSINYVINVFIYNKRNFTNTNRKVTFDIDINDSEIIVNKIQRGFSRDIPNVQRGGQSTRGSTLYKPKSDVSKLDGTESSKLEFTDVKFTETPKKMVDRKSWILPKEWNNNNLVIPSRKIIHVWDCNGVEVTSDNMQNTPILNHGMRPLNNVPNFVNYNFENKENDSNNHWLFDLTEAV